MVDESGENLSPGELLTKLHAKRFPLAARYRGYAKEAHQRSEDEKMHDPLTGLGNRRWWNSYVENYLPHADREMESVSVGVADLDGLKRINDTWGHAVGDQALVFMAHVIRDNIRTSDILARVGGDEFYFLFPSTSEEEALEVRNRIYEELRVAVSELPEDSILKGLDLGLSMGVNEWTGDDTFSKTLHLADQAAYKEKHNKGKARE